MLLFFAGLGLFVAGMITGIGLLILFFVYSLLHGDVL